MRSGLAVLGFSTASLTLATLPATAAGPTISGPTILSFAVPFATGAQAFTVSAGGVACGDGTVSNFLGPTNQRALIWKGTTVTDISPTTGGSHQISCIGVSDDGNTSTGEELLTNGSVGSFVRQGSTTTLLPGTLQARGVAGDGTVLLVQESAEQDTAALWHNGITTAISPTGAGAWQGVAISPKGVVTGFGAAGAYLYSGGVSAVLPTPAGMTAASAGIAADNGFVLGSAVAGTNTAHLLWHGSIVNKAWQGTTTVLQAPTGIGAVQAIRPTGVNASGTVVGDVDTAASTYPVRWSASGVPTLISATLGYANAINDAGLILGGLGGGSAAKPVVWDGTSTLSISSGGYSNAYPFAISDAGKIVGFVETSGFFDNGPHAASWAVTG